MKYIDNLIGQEPQEIDFDIIKQFQDSNKLHPDWFPLITYDMVQSGYPRPDHAEMIARCYGGVDSENRLLPGTGMWCKTEDVKNYLIKLKNNELV